MGNSVIASLDGIAEIIGQQKVNVFSLLATPQITAATAEYRAHEPHDPGFNVFLLVSDLYYRENFHNDMLRAFLDPLGKHQQRVGFLLDFLNYLNQQNSGPQLAIENYANAQLYRERGRVDVLIQDESSRKAIIIENKINRAADQPRQLPNYYRALTEAGYDVEAVVCLLLNYHLPPSMSDWAPEEVSIITDKLIIIKAFNGTSTDLIRGWLVPCMRAAIQPEAGFIIKQYISLITKLGELAMNKQLMQTFYEQMQTLDRYETPKSVGQLLADLPLYRLERIVDFYAASYYPFEVFNWNNRAAVFDRVKYQDSFYAIDIVPEGDLTKFQFLIRQGDSPSLTDILAELGLPDGFVPHGDRMQRIFRFPEEEQKLYDLINSFKVSFKKLHEK